MKLKAAIRDDTGSDLLMHVFGSPGFAEAFYDMLEDTFGIMNARGRPAEYYVQMPDRAITPMMDAENGLRGVEVRLTGVSRAGRDPQVFVDALGQLEVVVERLLFNNLFVGSSAQMFVVMMLDGEIPLPDGSYASVLESKPGWVDGAKASASL